MFFTMVVNPDNICTETLEEIFRQAHFEVTVDADNDLLIKDMYACFISNCKESIRIATAFQFRKKSTREQRMDLANVINADCEAIRATVMAKRTLVIDWFIPIRGGLPAANLIQAFRAFNGRTQNALFTCDTDDIVA